MKIIVTGALGHIGSKLIRVLPSIFKNSEIILIDSLKTQRFTSLFNLPSSGNYKFYELDLLQDPLDHLFKAADYVVHLAAMTDAASSFENPGEVEKSNFESTKVVTELCLKYAVRLILVSSTSVYGTQKNVVDENCDSEDLKPQSPYAKTKLKEEAFVQYCVKEKKLEACIFRFGTIFGISPGIRFHTAVNKFCYQAAFNKPITVWKTALDQKRPYLDIDDAINAISFVIKQRLFSGDIYNIVTANFSVRAIADEIKKTIPNLEIELVDNEIMNQLSYNVLSKKIQNEGFKFSGSIEQSISDTLKLFKSITN
jgi:UDP-glucose 4-epimerase